MLLAVGVTAQTTVVASAGYVAMARVTLGALRVLFLLMEPRQVASLVAARARRQARHSARSMRPMTVLAARRQLAVGRLRFAGVALRARRCRVRA